MIKQIKQYQNDIIMNKDNIPNLVKTIVMELNRYIKEEVYDCFEHNNRNPLEFYLIKHENVDIRLKEYKIMSQFSLNKYLNNKVVLIRVQISNIFSIKHNRLIGAIGYCDSFLSCFDEIFCLTQDILVTKFWYSSYLHYYENIQTKYDIFNKLKTTHKGDLDSKLSDIRFQGAMFYVDRYNIPLSFSNENFYSLNGGLWLLDNFIYLNDKSLGPIIFSKDNIDEIMIKDDIKFLMIFIFFKEIDKVPLTGIVTGEFLIVFPSSQIKRNKDLILNYFRKNYSISNIDGNNYTYSKVVKYITSFDDVSNNGDYEKNNRNLSEIEKSAEKYFEYEYHLVQNNFKFLSSKQFSSDLYEITKNKDKNLPRIKLIPVFGMINSNIEFFTNSLYEFIIKQQSKKKVSILKLDDSEFSNIDNLSNDLNKFFNNCEKNLEYYVILEIKFEIPIFQFLDIMINLTVNFWEKFDIVNICYAVNYLCFIKNEYKSIFYNIKNCLNTDLCQVIFIDEGEVRSRKKDLLSNQIASKGLVFNKRSFLIGLKEIKSIYTDKSFSRNAFEFVLNSNLYKTIQMVHLYNEQIFIPFNYCMIQELFEKFIRERLTRPIYIKALNTSNESINKLPLKLTGKFIMTDIEFQEELISMVNDCKDQSFFTIEKINGVHRYQNTQSLIRIKANYKLFDVQQIKDVKKTNVGFIITGKNCGKYADRIQKMFYSFCGGKIPIHKQYITRDSLTEDEVEKINLINLEADYADDWYRDGLIFVDKENNRSAYHPNLNQFIEEYIIARNRVIDNINKEIDEEIAKFFIIN